MQRLRLKFNFGASTVDITEGVIWKQLLLFAIPLLLSNLLQQLYSAVDLAIVGQFVGNTAMAAVGSTGALTNLITGFFLGLSTGASVVLSQFYGAQDHENISKTVHTAIAVSAMGGAVLMILGVMLTPTMLEWMQTPEDILPEAVEYLRAIFLGIIPIMMYNMGAGILRAIGDSRRPLYYLITSCLVNLVLDLLFVGPFQWGVTGAAVATVLSQAVSMLLILFCLARSTESYRLYWRRIFRINGGILLRIVRIGLPAGMQTVVIALSNVVIQSQINQFGSIAVGGVSAAGKIDGFVYMPAAVFGLAITTFVGQNFGAQKMDRVKKSVRVGLVMSVSSTMAFGLTALLFGRQLLGLFNSDPQVIEYGREMMVVLVVSYWIFACSEIFAGAMRGAGSATIPMMVSIICMCGVRLLWIIIALKFWDDILVVFLSYPISWTITALTMMTFYLRGRWMHPKKRHKKPAKAEA